MRHVLAILTLALVAAAIFFAASNRTAVPVDFHFFEVELPLGIALIASLVIGWIAGGAIAWLGLARSARRRDRAPAASAVDDGRSPR